MRIGNFRYKILVIVLLFIGATEICNAQNIVIYGDTRNNHSAHRSVVRALLKEKPIIVFHTGDLVFNGRLRSQWNTFNSIVSDITATSKLYPCYGNHELKSKLMTEFYKLPNDGKWYSIDTMGIHFVVLDVTSKYRKNSPQYKWLIKDLENKHSKFTIIVMHKPPFTTSVHKSSTKKPRKILVPIFEKYKVDAVFTGHVHAYEKSIVNDIYYITTAGGGAPFYPQISKSDYCKIYVNRYHFCKLWVEKNTLNVQAIDTNLNIIDKFQITK